MKFILKTRNRCNLSLSQTVCQLTQYYFDRSIFPPPIQNSTFLYSKFLPTPRLFLDFLFCSINLSVYSPFCFLEGKLIYFQDKTTQTSKKKKKKVIYWFTKADYFLEWLCLLHSHQQCMSALFIILAILIRS